LFEKAAESLATSSSTSKELKELRTLYDEAVKNTTQLEHEINQVEEFSSA
jgi:hypothetical protein